MDLSPGLLYFLHQLQTLLLSLGSQFSLTSLAAALGIAALFVAYRRHKKNRRVRLRTIIRALFPKSFTGSRSHAADFGFLFFNVFVFGLAFGWAILSYQFLTNGIITVLVKAFGPMAPTTLPGFVSSAIVTVMIFLAYELGYWVNHYLSHRIPFLWEFHKVHHSAEVLSPVTSARIHPVYALIFANILALSAAIANGFANYLFGNNAYQYALADTNIILVIFIHTYGHLQHTHMWISFQGWLGRVVMSPAHHQVHHSTNPKHFNKNLGSALAIWDWVFGTLYVPSKEREKLSFGIGPEHVHAHTITGEMIEPFVRAYRLVRIGLRRIFARRAEIAPHKPEASAIEPGITPQAH